jgi:uncharacterized protein YecT (DUF1311 family)
VRSLLAAVALTAAVVLSSVRPAQAEASASPAPIDTQVALITTLRHCLTALPVWQDDQRDACYRSANFAFESAISRVAAYDEASIDSQSRVLLQKSESAWLRYYRAQQNTRRMLFIRQGHRSQAMAFDQSLLRDLLARFSLLTLVSGNDEASSPEPAGDTSVPIPDAFHDRVPARLEHCLQRPTNQTTFGMLVCTDTAVREYRQNIDRLQRIIMANADQPQRTAFALSQRAWRASQASDIAFWQGPWYRERGTIIGPESSMVIMDQTRARVMEMYLIGNMHIPWSN